MKTTNYSKYFALITFTNSVYSRSLEIVAIDEDAARNDITEAFANVKEIQLGRMGAA